MTNTRKYNVNISFSIAEELSDNEAEKLERKLYDKVGEALQGHETDDDVYVDMMIDNETKR